MLCDFDENLICRHCGHAARKVKTYRHCPERPHEDGADGPPLIVRAANYVSAVTRWIEAGRPVRTQAEIDAILSGQCGPCEHFRDGTCRQCGCAISRSPAALRNKLAMGTESCPVGRW